MNARAAASAAALALGSIANVRVEPAAPTPVPVVVELFTSEGCSDCPPADRVLQSLGGGQPIERAHVLILSEHVDYFNHDGWADPFSSERFTARQYAYDAHTPRATPYTPEMIVDGTAHLIGSDRAAAFAAVARAANRPKADVHLAWLAGDPRQLEISLPAGGAALAKARVLVAVTEDGLRSSVTAGENKGRALTHDGVVRQLTDVGSVDAQGRFHRIWPVKLDRAWIGRLNIVVLIQPEAGAVLGAAAIGVT